jgi:hypothetical protein
MATGSGAVDGGVSVIFTVNARRRPDGYSQ